MKATFIPDPRNPDIVYPCLMCRVHDPKLALDKDFIVLFSSHKVGTVVSREKQAPGMLGSHSDGWDMTQFEPCHGRVILESP